MRITFIALAVSLGTLCGSMPISAQAQPPSDGCATAIDRAAMDHSAHSAMMKPCETSKGTMSGQAAFAAIADVVAQLRADPNTDWSRVNVEALRQHLTDMDDVVLHAVATSHTVPFGLEIDVSGTGRTVGAIQRMVVNHARMLDQMPEYRATVASRPNRVRLRVTARDTTDARRVAELRGLGFAGILTEGDHHAAHHLAIARGDATAHGR